MFETVDIPVWGLWVAGILACIALLDRILMPTVRWYLQRRLNRAVGLLNDRLQLKIQPFKLTKRRVMIDRLAYDPKVIEAILEHCKTEGVPYPVAEQMAYRYAREIVPSFSALGYFGFAIRAARWLSTALYRVRLGYVDETSLRDMDPEATVIFVINHRSNMDYVLVTYLAASRSALSYAVGEWARVWPLKQLIRSMGAYFIRRKSRNLLYRRVLARYVQMATEAGVAQAIFPEGGLSRDGHLQPAKLGLLSYVVSGYKADDHRDVLFVPVGLNYDRVMEDRVLLATGKERAPLWLKIWGVVRFIGRHFWLRITGKFRRFGYASVSFGKPVSLRAFIAKSKSTKHETLTRNLGKDLMKRVGEVIPVLPVSLISRVFLMQEGQPLSHAKLVEIAQAELDRLVANGAHIHIPRKKFDYAVDVGLRMLTMRHAVTMVNDGYVVAPDQEDVVRYYANAIAHLA